MNQLTVAILYVNDKLVIPRKQVQYGQYFTRFSHLSVISLP